MSKKYLGILATVFLAAGTAESRETVSLQQTTLKSNSVYMTAEEGFESLTLKQVENDSMSVTVMKGTGKLDAINSTSRSEDRKVPGIDQGGHSIIKIEKDPENAKGAIITVDVLVEDEVEGVPVRIENTKVRKAEFNLGTFEGLMEGKEVQLRFTKESQRQKEKELVTKLEELLASVQDAILLQAGVGGDIKISPINVDKIKITGTTVISGTKAKLSISNPVMDILMSFKVKM